MTELERLLNDIQMQLSEESLLSDESKLYTIELLIKKYHEDDKRSETPPFPLSD